VEGPANNDIVVEGDKKGDQDGTETQPWDTRDDCILLVYSSMNSTRGSVYSVLTTYRKIVGQDSCPYIKASIKSF
jgi:hypothetical protein